MPLFTVSWSPCQISGGWGGSCNDNFSFSCASLVLRINRCSTSLTLPPVRCYPSKTPVENIIRIMQSIEIWIETCKIKEFATWAHLPYMSMTAKTVVGKFEAATPCGGKKGYLVKIQKMMSSPEKNTTEIHERALLFSKSRIWRILAKCGKSHHIENQEMRKPGRRRWQRRAGRPGSFSRRPPMHVHLLYNT